MKKRLLAVLVAAVTAVSLLACGGGSSSSGGTDTAKTEEAGDAGEAAASDMKVAMVTDYPGMRRRIKQLRRIRER